LDDRRRCGRRHRIAVGSQAVTVTLGACDLVARPAGGPARVLRAAASLLFALGG
jgi:hypothetical protein